MHTNNLLEIFKLPEQKKSIPNIPIHLMHFYFVAEQVKTFFAVCNSSPIELILPAVSAELS